MERAEAHEVSDADAVPRGGFLDLRVLGMRDEDLELDVAQVLGVTAHGMKGVWHERTGTVKVPDWSCSHVALKLLWSR